MKLGLLIAASAVLSVSAVATASAGVEWGQPDFPNYLSAPGNVFCDWTTTAYIRACPTPQEVPAEAAPAPTKAKHKKS